MDAKIDFNELTDCIKTLTETLKHIVPDEGPIEMKEVVTRGVGAGATYRKLIRKGKTVLNFEDIMRLVIEAYAENGEYCPLQHFRTSELTLVVNMILNCIKIAVSKGSFVNINDHLQFEPRNYTDGREGAYLACYTKGSDWMKLDAEIQLKDSPELIALKQKRAERKPYDIVASAEPKKIKAGRETYVTCPNCGMRILIEDSAS